MSSDQWHPNPISNIRYRIYETLSNNKRKFSKCT